MKVAFLFLTLVMAIQAYGSQSMEARLYENIAKRLSLMKDVALYKHENGKPVEDRKREKDILDRMHTLAKEHQLNANKMVAFMTVQMSVAKSIQYRHRADFLFEKPSGSPRDLNGIRRDISSITTNIFSELSAACQHHGFAKLDQSLASFNSAVNIEYVKSNEKQALFDAMIAVCD